MNKAQIIKHLDGIKKDDENEYVRSYGIVKVTKEYYKINKNKFEIYSYLDGLLIATVTKSKMVKYLLGEIDDTNLNWN